MGFITDSITAPYRFTGLWLKSDEVIAEITGFDMSCQLPPHVYKSIGKDVTDRFLDSTYHGVKWEIDDITILKLAHLQYYASSVGEEEAAHLFAEAYTRYMYSQCMFSDQKHQLHIQEMQHIAALYSKT